jgi:hypothetical protein
MHRVSVASALQPPLYGWLSVSDFVKLVACAKLFVRGSLWTAFHGWLSVAGSVRLAALGRLAMTGSRSLESRLLRAAYGELAGSLQSLRKCNAVRDPKHCGRKSLLEGVFRRPSHAQSPVRVHQHRRLESDCKIYKAHSYTGTQNRTQPMFRGREWKWRYPASASTALQHGVLHQSKHGMGPHGTGGHCSGGGSEI